MAGALVALVTLTIAPDGWAQAALQRATAYVVAVADGDIFYMEIDGKRTHVRIAQIDAPEAGQAFGRRSEPSLRELIWKRTVMVSWRDVDRYGRPIVAVDHAGADVGAEQVRRGMAWVYRQYSKDRSRYALESEARAARRGLWADSQSAPPWEWRKMATGQAPML